MTRNEFSCNSLEVTLASSSSRVESSWSRVGECNSSDFSLKDFCSSPRSGRSWVKVDVLRRCSLPKIFSSICDWEYEASTSLRR